jgi:SOS response regulatory protein OraA/RecX
MWLSGDPFTIKELKRALSKNNTEARNIERKLHEFHRLGYIKPKRKQLRGPWAATSRR